MLIFFKSFLLYSYKTAIVNFTNKFLRSREKVRREGIGIISYVFCKYALNGV
jgi:hypothetical protein